MKLTKPDILALPHHKAIGFDGLKNFKIPGISIDSRTMKAGELFIAIRGDQFDGHNFISKAIEMGAAGIIVERRWAEANATMMVSIHIPRLTVENTIHALGNLAMGISAEVRHSVYCSRRIEREDNNKRNAEGYPQSKI
jgi:UDP-N-acetylmuramyl pentapeptide synthase